MSGTVLDGEINVPDQGMPKTGSNNGSGHLFRPSHAASLSGGVVGRQERFLTPFPLCAMFRHWSCIL